MSICGISTLTALGHAGFAGTYTTVVAVPKEAISIIIATTLDESVMLSLDSGATDHLAINKEANYGGPLEISLLQDELGVSKYAGYNVQVKDIGTPTAGSIYVSFKVRA